MRGRRSKMDKAMLDIGMFLAVQALVDFKNPQVLLVVRGGLLVASLVWFQLLQIIIDRLERRERERAGAGADAAAGAGDFGVRIWVPKPKAP